MQHRRTKKSISGDDAEKPAGAVAEKPVQLDLSAFPTLTEGIPRCLYFDVLDPLSSACLRIRGYNPICLATLPQGTDVEKVLYLRALLQGLQDGTIQGKTDRLKAIELEMKARGMLAGNQARLNVQVKIDSLDVLKQLDWQPTRHTLRDNTTLVPLLALPLKKVESGD